MWSEINVNLHPQSTEKIKTMENKKAYFIDAEDSIIYEISSRKRKELEKKHPNWFCYGTDDDGLTDTLSFFKEYGKILSTPYQKNAFIGFII